MAPSNQSGQTGHNQTGKSAGFPRRFGKYTLLAHLATGGMADVFLARHLGPAGFEKECVIKRILPHLTQDANTQSFIDMFLDEARIAARLSHPNIVHIFDLGQVDGDYFLALEYVDGITIEDILERTREQGQPALPWPIAARIVSNVAEGLEHAHKAKDSSDNPLLLVHRDISPSNIMVSWDGVAKVLDFGIAKAMSMSAPKVKTGVGIIKGKVPYMSPEQIQGLDLDGRSDVFSLGVVLYEMTTGQRPFPGDTTGQLTVQITSREPSSPELLNPAFPRDLWPVLLKSLSKAVDARYQSARDFKLDLEQFLSDQLVTCTNYDVEAYLRELVPKRPRRELPSAEEIARVETEAEEEAAAAATAPISPVAGSGSGAISTRNTGRRPSGEASAATPGQSAASSRTPGKDVAESTASGRRMSPREETSADALEAEDQAEQQRHRQSSSSGLIMAFIAILVIGTGVIFYVLRQRAMNQTEVATPGDTTPPMTTPPTTTPPTTTPPTTTPPTVATTPTGDKPATPTTPTGDKPATPTGEKKVAVEKTEKEDKPATPDKAEKTEKPEVAAKTDDSGEDKPKTKPRRTKKHDEEEGSKDISSKLPLPPPPPPEP